MGVYKLSSAGGITTPRTNYSSFLAGNPAFIPTVTIDYLVVAGGGSGGREDYGSGLGGGGGAGGLRSTVTATGGGGSLEIKEPLIQ